jgi:hypothetical protein
MNRSTRTLAFHTYESKREGKGIGEKCEGKKLRDESETPISLMSRHRKWA